MKAILINATERSVKEVDIKGDLKSWYDQIGCDVVEVACYLPSSNMLLVDEEGMLKAPTHFFEFNKNVLAGNGLIVGTNDDGDTSSATLNVDDIMFNVKFYDKQELLHNTIYQ
jgi:hypothetical protein